MKQELLSVLEPALNKFIADLIKIHDQRLEQLREAEKQVENLHRQRAEAKEQENENNRSAQAALDKIAEERLKQVQLNNQINDEIARYNKLVKEYETKVFEQEETLKGIRAEKEMISRSLDAAKKKEEVLANTTLFLKEDREKLNAKTRELEEREKKLFISEKVIDKRERDYEDKEKRFEYIDLNLRSRELEVKRLIKRYNLEKFIEAKA